ncbi:MAG: prepilin-type N-terminal cleavage/methylation domain-containing protein [Phycisphaerales bacterium]|nr:prepilin-type N-terminal cleavage/methylation domain-containing protein [Phycisphaerales bacterium]
MTTRTRGAGFTLIELLVVVAIIGILLSVLLPTLGTARYATRSLKGLSNLKQLGAGWHMYATDNRDLMLPGRFGDLGGGAGNPANLYDVGNGKKFRPRWAASLGPYVDLFAFTNPDIANDRQDYTGEVYLCPNASDRSDERNHGYGYNHQFLGNGRLVNGKFRYWPVRRAKVSTFSGTVMAGDSLGTAAGVPEAARLPYENNGTNQNSIGNESWPLDPPRLTATSDRGSGNSASPRGGADARQRGGRANMVFCDGHGEAMTLVDLGYRLNADGSFVEFGGGANAPSNRLFSGTGRDDDPPGIPP